MESNKQLTNFIVITTITDIPYHLGKCNNYGILHSKGDIVSVMDGDQLLPQDFLNKLTEAHSGIPKVINIERVMCKHPLGVSSPKLIQKC